MTTMAVRPLGPPATKVAAGLAPRLATAVMCALLVAGCGRSLGERALGGGVIGATAGAAGTAIFGGPVLAGAAIGAAAGALGGVLLNPDVVDLGDPPDL